MNPLEIQLLKIKENPYIFFDNGCSVDSIHAFLTAYQYNEWNDDAKAYYRELFDGFQQYVALHYDFPLTVGWWSDIMVASGNDSQKSVELFFELWNRFTEMKRKAVKIRFEDFQKVVYSDGIGDRVFYFFDAYLLEKYNCFVPEKIEICNEGKSNVRFYRLNGEIIDYNELSRRCEKMKNERGEILLCEEKN